jgi:hypothetical protein
LTGLTLHEGISQLELDLTYLGYVSLVALKILSFNSFDITGLVNLTSLDFPNLKTLAFQNVVPRRTAKILLLYNWLSKVSIWVEVGSGENNNFFLLVECVLLNNAKFATENDYFIKLLKNIRD